MILLIVTMTDRIYGKYFGFSTPPFTGSDSGAFFNSTSHRTAHECLSRGFLKPGGILLFTGEAGTGKSLLLQRLSTELQGKVRCLAFWNAHLSIDDVLDYLCTVPELSLVPDGGGKTSQTAETKTDPDSPRPAPVVLIDSAQHLPEETLRGLKQIVRLEIDGQRLLRIVLSGTPELETRLRGQPALRPLLEDMDRRCRLPHLQDEDIVPYIQARLQASGYNGPTLFTDNALAKIVDHADGIPRRINLICDQALLLAYLSSEKHVTATLIRPVSQQSQLREPSGNNFPTVAPTTSASPTTRPRHTTRQSSAMPERGALATSTSSPISAQTAVNPEAPSASAANPLPPTGTPANDHAPADIFPTEAMSATTVPSAANTISLPTDFEPHPEHHPRPRRPQYLMSFFLILFITAAAIVGMHYMDSSHWQRLEQRIQPLLQSIKPHRDPQPSAQLPTQSTPGSSAEPQPSTALNNPERANTTTPRVEATAKSDASEPEGKVAERIQVLQEQADRQMANLKYIRPQGDNALASYREILRLDPNNVDALLGIERIKTGFILWSEYARARGDLAKARAHLQAALIVDPDNNALRERLQSLGQQQPNAQASSKLTE